MEIFLNNNNFQELILNLHRVKFLNIAVIHTLVLLAFIGIVIFIPFISSYKTKADIMNLTKFIHLLSIIWIMISCFIMKALNYKLPESLRFFFGLKFAGILVLAILILVYSLPSNASKSYKNILINAFLNIYLSYVFIFIALEKSVIVLILGLIIIFFVNRGFQNGINIAEKTYSKIQYIDEDFNQLILMNSEFYLKFKSLRDSIKSIARNNNITIDLYGIELIGGSNMHIFNEKKFLNDVEKSFSLNEHIINENLKEIWVIYNNQHLNDFKYLKDCLEQLISKQFGLYNSLKYQKFDKQLDKEFVGNYKTVIDAEKNKLITISNSLINLAFNEESYREINEVLIKQLEDSLSTVAKLKNKPDQVIIELPNLPSHK